MPEYKAGDRVVVAPDEDGVEFIGGCIGTVRLPTTGAWLPVRMDCEPEDMFFLKAEQLRLATDTDAGCGARP